MLSCVTGLLDTWGALSGPCQARPSRHLCCHTIMVWETPLNAKGKGSLTSPSSRPPHFSELHQSSTLLGADPCRCRAQSWSSVSTPACKSFIPCVQRGDYSICFLFRPEPQLLMMQPKLPFNQKPFLASKLSSMPSAPEFRFEIQCQLVFYSAGLYGTPGCV